MGATSVTGIGAGDSQKRVAYTHVNLPGLQITETTTGNHQDLIPAGGSGGGGNGGNGNGPADIVDRRNIRISSGSTNDFSVNDARVYVNYQQRLVFEGNVFQRF